MRQLQRPVQKLLISPQALTPAGTVAATVDLAAFGGMYADCKPLALEIDVALSTSKGGTDAANPPVIQILESDTTAATTGTNWATVTANQSPLTGTTAGIVSYFIPDSAPRKRYLAISMGIVATAGGATTTNDSMVVSAIARALVGEEPAEIANTVVLVV